MNSSMHVMCCATSCSTVKSLESAAAQLMTKHHPNVAHAHGSNHVPAQYSKRVAA